MFDLARFQNTQFKPRTAVVPVPELAEFFPHLHKPEFTVRSLSGPEYGRVIDELNQGQSEDIARLQASIAAGDTGEIMRGMSGWLDGIKQRLPNDVIRRTYLIEYGLVEPSMHHEAVVKLREVNAEVFYRLSKKIMELTGLGYTSGESTASGDASASSGRSLSAPPEALQAE